MADNLYSDQKFAHGAGIALQKTDGTDASQAVTLTGMMGTITSSTADLAADTNETITVTNENVSASDIVLVMPAAGGAGDIAIVDVTPANGSFAVVARNVDASNACDAVYKLHYVVIKKVV